MKKFFLILSLFALSAFAEEDFDKAAEEFKDTPQNQTDEMAWLEPYDETYLPYGVSR